MKAATGIARKTDRILTPNEQLQAEMDQLLAKRNFVRAVSLAQKLELSEQRIRQLQQAAVQQYVLEYQNFAGAVQLLHDYGFTAIELNDLCTRISAQLTLSNQPTFSWQFGQTAYLSVTEQVQQFFRRTRQMLQKQTRRHHWRAAWQRLMSTLRSWFDNLFTPRNGGFSPGGPAYA